MIWFLQAKMSEIANVLSKLKGTQEASILLEMEAAYEKVSALQGEWYSKSKFTCPEGCGSCCHNFEPDLLDCEALYMAAWLIENQAEVATAIEEGNFPFENGKTCPFHNFENPYHCSIYNGRPSICRFFGGCGAYGKNQEVVWKPCKFYPEEMLKMHKPELSHRQYSASEVLDIFGTLPPVMSDLMEEIVSFEPDNRETKLIREILPETIKRIKWICSLNNGSDNAA